MPTPSDAAASRYYTVQAATSAAVVSTLSGLWSSLGDDFDAGWAQIRDQASLAVIGGQLRTATAAPIYLDALMSIEGVTPEATEQVAVRDFAGITASGMSVEQALTTAVIVAKQGVGSGLFPAQARARGLSQLTMIGATAVQDAGRGCMQSRMLLEPQVSGYVRYVRLPACGRCIVQAGKFFHKNTGFQRHPRCDCQHRPLVGDHRDRSIEQDPRELYDSMTPQQQVNAVGGAAAHAIREGADLGQVVNARSGMQAAGQHVTTSGTTVRGTFGKRQDDLAKRGGRYRSTGKPRLSPQGVAYHAHGDPVVYRRLLKEQGYIT